MGMYMSSSGSDGDESWLVFRASDFELGKEDNVGTRRAQVITCKLIPKGLGEKKEVSFTETLWLDLETNLPLKRVFSGDFGGKKIKFTETYDKFVLDPKVDAKVFELGK